MTASGLASRLAVAQGVYYAATGAWSLVGDRSFMRVTGPKTDVWLVKTVGTLVLALGAALALAGRRGRVTPEMALLASGSAAGLAAIDAYYAGVGRIRKVYLLDAVAEMALILAWALAWRAREG